MRPVRAIDLKLVGSGTDFEVLTSVKRPKKLADFRKVVDVTAAGDSIKLRTPGAQRTVRHGLAHAAALRRQRLRRRAARREGGRLTTMTPSDMTAPADTDERSDEELLAAHVAGDPDAFSVIVRRQSDRLWAVALRTCRDPEEAADAVQDALINAYRRAGTFRGTARVSTWLHRIVVNACLDRIRANKVRRAVPLPDHTDDAALAEPHRIGSTNTPRA